MLSRMLKDVCQQDGRDVKITWEERTMSITIRGRRLGYDQRRTSMLESKERRWSSNSLRRGQDIKLACCQKIVQGPIRQLYRSGKVRRPHHHHHQRMPRTQHRWWLQARLQPVQENCRRDGSNGTLRKVERTSLTITLERLHGWTLGDSNTSECTGRTQLDPETVPFNSSLSRNWDLYRAAGNCVSPTLRVSTLLTTTRRLQPGTIRDCHLPSTRTYHSTSVTLGESSSTSGLSPHCGYCPDNVMSRSDERTYSKTHTRRSCDKVRTT